MKLRLKRCTSNPVLSPLKKNAWESLSVCNPGAWYENGTFYLLYRAAGEDKEHIIRFGLAVSKDGFRFERVSDKPILSPAADSPDSGGIEDPRIVKFDDVFYITYAYRPFPPGQYWLPDKEKHQGPYGPASAPKVIRDNVANSGILTSKDLRTFRRLGRITRSDLDDRDVILFPEKINGKYVMLHRPKDWIGEKYSCRHPSIWISFSDDLLVWEEDRLLLKGTYPWEEKVGGSCPPLKTDEGWLTLYHGVDGKGVYRAGVMLLDLKDPAQIIARASEFILEPEEEYERRGLWPNCVFPTGNVIVGDEVFIYYGAADKYCCAATAKVRNLIDACFNK